MHLFISHATKDCAREAEALTNALEAMGHRCWIAPRDVKPGIPYPRQIVEAVEQAAGMVLLLSAAANDSPDVLQEVQLASSARKIIAPVIVRGAVPGADLRYYIGVRHHVTWVKADAVAATLLPTFVQKGAPRPEPVKPRFAPGDVVRDGPNLPEMVVIPPGRFMMGSPVHEEGRRENEGPQREVRIERAFALGKYPVTFAEWDAALAESAKLRRPDDEGWGRDRRPVINVSWDDAQAYVAWLNARVAGRPYRLPSESEWEYACRAGTTTPYSTGASISPSQANFDGGAGRTQPVGSYPANAFGLHDMHGNVWEWVQDCYEGSYAGLLSDGSAYETSDCSIRMNRGGSWNSSPPRYQRSAVRDANTPTYRYSGLGFRVARTI